MDKQIRKLVQSHIIDYLKYHNSDLKVTKRGLFDCPFKSEHEKKSDKPSCNIFPPDTYKLHCFDSAHGKLGDIFDIFRKFEPDMKHLDDEEIADYLINLLDIRTNEKLDNLLAKYHNWKWALIPLQPKSKDPIQGISWKKKSSKNLNEWKDWIKSDLNVGLHLGQISQVVAIDIDDPETFEKVKHLLGETLIQTTKRGHHYIYLYDSDFDEINHANLRSKGYEMELRANNAYVVIAPSSAEGEVRSWNEKEPIAMPKELKKFLLELIDKPKEINTTDKIKKAIDNGDLGIIDGLTGLDGQCNDVFIKLGGILRKKLNPEQVEWSLFNFNKLLADPMDNKALRAMSQQIAKYYKYDKKDLADELLKHLQILEASTARDLKDSLKEEKKDIEESLDYLVKEGRIQKLGRLYKFVPKVDWETDFMSVGKSLDFEIPFFSKYANFENGSMIIVGAGSGIGKTHIACNLLKEFIDKELQPRYLCAEAGSRFKMISAQLGLKEGDYKFKVVADPSKYELDDNVVTIIDWLKPKNSDYAKTDTIYETLNNQLVKHGGLLIVFAQLRKNGDFFAPDMIDFYASLVAKYNHSKMKDSQGNITYDNENTYFKTEKIRDSKVGLQYVTIPTFFNRETKRLTLRGEQ